MNALSATALNTVFAVLGELAVAFFRHAENIVSAGEHIHADRFVIGAKADTAHTHGSAAHRPNIFGFKADGITQMGADDHILAAVNDAYANEFIIFFEIDADDAVFPGGIIIRQRGFFDNASFGGHEQILVVVKGFNLQHGCDGFIGIQLQNIDNRRAAGCASGFGDFVCFEPVEFAFIGKEQQIIVSRRDEEMFNKVVFPGGKGRNAFSSAVLRAIGVGGNAFDITHVSHGDDHFLFFDQILHIQGVGVNIEGSTAGITVFVLDLV